MKNYIGKCKFCGEVITEKTVINDERDYNTYKNGSIGHEDCHDVNEFEQENAIDLHDHLPVT